MADQSQPQDDYLSRVFAATSTSESTNLYDQWASTYDADMVSHDFKAPRIVAETLAEYVNTASKSSAVIVDAGCGSGAVGLQLKNVGFTGPIDGLDLSQGMLDVARKTDAYRDLKITDLTKRVDASDGEYDGLTCCGTFTHSHLGPEPLEEFVRVVKKGGVLVATVLEMHWVEKGFEREVERLRESGSVEVLEKEVHAYRKQSGGGRVLVLRRL
ncbi:S-adenosyl-L-methionine-dependent methyltransferase [Lophiostoma macrostomum CBS 122681]|uniref:S-adenosyl-L-methionine-dependent methyltransferase n=1 Tax=Lophiostoma macrostomum CBS 122681 TaxID=1314788 RepID=A0A6A6SRJ3_9PLEO|nr:S-adenosyl-L-methionine-dependent methyltransferase [Lophiostoma macrostomum CBS 122681]